MKNLALVMLLLMMASCGPQNTSSNGLLCTPNFIGNGVPIMMSSIGGNSYKITLCSDVNTSGTYSVFGGDTENAISPNVINFNGQVRKAHFNGSTAGTILQVDFNSSDVFFVFYLDGASGNYSTTTQLVSGRITGR